MIGEGNRGLFGHGTYIAALIVGMSFGVAKGTSIVSLKACDRNGVCTEFDIIDVLTWAYMNRQSGSNIILINLKSDSIGRDVCETLKFLSDAEFLVVISVERYVSSACLVPLLTSNHVILVGTTDIEDRVAAFSVSGKVVDVFAPGVDIESAWIGSRYATAVLS